MIRINGDVVKARYGYTIRKTLKEDFDSATITIISKRAYKYHQLDVVDIQESNINEQFVVHEPKDVLLNDDGLFEHEMTLVEPAFRFTKVFPPNNNFDTINVPNTPNQTIRSILDVYIKHLEHYENIILEVEEGDYLDKVVPEKPFVSQDFYTIAKELFRRVVAVPKFEYLEGFGWKLYPQFQNELKEMRDFKRDGIVETGDPFGQASKLKADLKNAVIESDDVAYFPSQFGYVKPRSSDVVVSPSNAVLPLPSDIMGFIEVEVLDQRWVEGESISEGPVDITNYIVTQNVFDGLETKTIVGLNTAERHKQNTLIYDIGSNEIKNLYIARDFLIFFGRNVVNFAISSALLAQGKTYLAPEEPLEIYDYKFRIKYSKRRDIAYNHYRNHIGLVNNATEIFNQRDNYINAERFAQNTKNASNRIGNRRITSPITFKKGANYYKNGDYDNEGKVVTDVSYTVFEDVVRVKYEMTENFVNVTGEYALSREPRATSLDDSGIVTNPIKNYFLVLSETQQSIAPNFFLNDNGVNTLLDFLRTTTPTHLFQINGALFRRIENNVPVGETLHLETEMVRGGNNIAIHTHFRHNVVGGYKIDEEEDELQQPIIYTDQDGRIKDYNIVYINAVEVIDEGSYPIVNFSDFNADQVSKVNINHPIDKQPNTRLAHTDVINFITDDSRLIFGTAFSKFNHLVKTPPPTGIELELYSSEKPYFISQEFVRDEDTLEEVGYNFSIVQRRLEVPSTLKHWAIAYNKEIVIAGNDITVVYFNLLTQEPDAVQINRVPTPNFITTFTDIELNSITVYVNNTASETVNMRVFIEGQELIKEVAPNQTESFLFEGLEEDTEYTFRAVAERITPSVYNLNSLVRQYIVKTESILIDTPTVNTQAVMYDSAIFNLINNEKWPIELTVEKQTLGNPFEYVKSFFMNSTNQSSSFDNLDKPIYELPQFDSLVELDRLIINGEAIGNYLEQSFYLFGDLPETGEIDVIFDIKNFQRISGSLSSLRFGILEGRTNDNAYWIQYYMPQDTPDSELIQTTIDMSQIDEKILGFRIWTGLGTAVVNADIIAGYYEFGEGVQIGTQEVTNAWLEANGYKIGNTIDYQKLFDDDYIEAPTEQALEDTIIGYEQIVITPKEITETIDGLEGNTTYTFRFKALPYLYNPKEPSANVLRVITTPPLMPVANPTLSEITVNGNSITFDVTNNDDYRISPLLEIFDLDTPDFEERELTPDILDPNETQTFTVGNLQPSTLYEVRVIARPAPSSPKVQNGQSVLRQFSTEDVADFTLSSISILQEEITIRVNNLFSFGGDLFKRIGTQSFVSDGSISPNDTRDIVFTGLDPNTTYTFSIRIDYTNGDTVTKTITRTTAQPPSPLAIPQIQSHTTDFYSVSVVVRNFEMQQAVIESRYKTVASGAGGTWFNGPELVHSALGGPDPDRIYDFTGLNEGTGYEFRFRTRVGTDLSNWSDILTTQTEGFPNIENYSFTLVPDRYDNLICQYENNTGYQVNLVIQWRNHTIGESFTSARQTTIANATTGSVNLAINNNSSFYEVGQDIRVQVKAVYNDEDVGEPVPDTAFVEQNIILPRPRITMPEYEMAITDPTATEIYMTLLNTDSTTAIDYVAFVVSESDIESYPPSVPFESMPSYQQITGTIAVAVGPPQIAFITFEDLLDNSRYLTGVQVSSAQGEYVKIGRSIFYQGPDDGFIRTAEYSESDDFLSAAVINVELDYQASSDHRPNIIFTNNSGEVANIIYGIYKVGTAPPANINTDFEYLNGIVNGGTRTVTGYQTWNGQTVAPDEFYRIKVKLVLDNPSSTPTETDWLLVNLPTFEIE